MNKILVVAAHPDDEILGVGATIAKYVQQGYETQCIILGEGQTSRWNNRDEAAHEIVEELHEDTLKAAKIIGYSKVHFANFPDNRFDGVDLLDVVKYIENIKNEFRPDIIYTHHGGDLNVDHQITFKAVLTATRPINDCSVKALYTFETLSSTEWDFSYNEIFKPNTYINVEETFDKKIEAMKCYETELCEFPHPRSLKGLELYAGKWGSVVGKSYVEAFQLIRRID